MKKQIIALITAMTAALSAAPFTALAENPSVSTFDNLSAASAVSVTSDIDFVRVSAGGFHSLALASDGTVWAWGSNDYGQLGNGTNVSTDNPQRVKGLENIVKISTRSDHNLAVDSNGAVWGWGRNDYGQLGIGNNVNQNVPVKIQTLSNVQDVSAGHQFSLALLNDGTVYSWGNNKNGQLGLADSYAFFNVPRKINGISDIKQITAGHYHAFALTEAGEVWGWGKNNYGQLGNGNTDDTNAPVSIPFTRKIISITAGLDNSFFAYDNVDGDCFDYIDVCGYNGDGQLGNGSTETVYTRQHLIYTDLDGFKDDMFHNTGIEMTSNSVTIIPDRYMCGLNYYGQFGDGTSTYRYTTLKEQNLPFMPQQSSAGGGHTLFLSGGDVYCAGRNHKGQCGQTPSDAVRTFNKAVHRHTYEEGEIQYKQQGQNSSEFIWERTDTCSSCGNTVTVSGKHEHDSEMIESYDVLRPTEEGCADWGLFKCNLCGYEYEDTIYLPHTYERTIYLHGVAEDALVPTGFEHQDFYYEKCIDCGYDHEDWVLDTPELFKTENIERDGKYYEVLYFHCSCGSDATVEHEIENTDN